jgi:hypothetical protein
MIQLRPLEGVDGCFGLGLSLHHRFVEFFLLFPMVYHVLGVIFNAMFSKIYTDKRDPVVFQNCVKIAKKIVFFLLKIAFFISFVSYVLEANNLHILPF